MPQPPLGRRSHVRRRESRVRATRTSSPVAPQAPWWPPPPCAGEGPGPVRSPTNVLVFEFPALSVTVIVMELLPEARGMVALQALVPVAPPLPPVAAFDHVTRVIGEGPDAVPVMVIGEDVAVDGGDVTV